MKYTELHRIIRENGWRPLPNRGKGSHILYEKDGVTFTVPLHKGKEIGNSFAKKLLLKLGINQKSE